MGQYDHRILTLEIWTRKLPEANASDPMCVQAKQLLPVRAGIGAQAYIWQDCQGSQAMGVKLKGREWPSWGQSAQSQEWVGKWCGQAWDGHRVLPAANWDLVKFLFTKYLFLWGAVCRSP